MMKVFRNKDFTLLFAGFFVSRLGNTLYNFAIAWYLYSKGVNPTIVSLYLATGLLVTLILSPFSGVFADRFPKKNILVVTDFIRGATVIITGLLLYFAVFSNEIILFFITTVILSINSSFFVPSAGALVPEVVGDENLQKANGAFSIISSFQTIFGALLGAAFIQFLGIELVFIINGASFIISGISEILIKVRYAKDNLDDTSFDIKSYLSDLKGGMKYLIEDKGILYLLIGVVLLNFAMTPLFSNGFPYLFSQELNQTNLLSG